MKRHKLGKRCLLIFALTGLALFIGTSTANAAWFYRTMWVQPTVGPPVQTQVMVPVQPGLYGDEYCPPSRSYRMQPYYPRSSQQLYHHLGKWPPYNR